MNRNIFEELQDKKQQLIALAQKAAEFGWIPQKGDSKADNHTISLEEIEEKLEKDTLTIGVIGQMKCGKSTFLNAFVFEDEILPAATTPMTAALSVITYGEKKRIVAEFYTKDEWAEQKAQAARSLEGLTALDESKVKAAKELVSKAQKLGTSLEGLLGKTQEDSFDHLIEYVGADGKYVSITKSVTIYYPKEYLKGVEIVDTPGFNDPIVSREERTKEFLKKADVVLMMLYAGRPFDATDRDIIFKNVRQCGIGKVLVGINKYDIPYCSEVNPEDEEQIKEYVKSEIRKACRECNDNTLVEILNDVEPIPLSAEMALLSELPMSKIPTAEDSAWARHCKNFEISTQAEMRQLSHLDDLVSAVKTMVNQEKDKILFAKPLNAIMAAGNKVQSDQANELNLVNSRIELLSMPDEEIEEQEFNLSKAHKRLSKKVESLGDDINNEMRDLVRKGKNELEDLVDAACRDLTHIVENEWSSFKSVESIIPRLDGRLQKLVTRDLKRAADDLADKGKREIKKSCSAFFEDAEDVLMRYLPDVNSKDFVKKTQAKVQLDIEEKDLFSFDNSETEQEVGLIDAVAEFINGFTFGLSNFLGNILSHGSVKSELLKRINDKCNEFDPEPYLQAIFAKKDAIIDLVKQAFIAELITPLLDQIQEIKTQISDKEKDLADTKAKKEALELKQAEIQKQVEEIGRLQATCK